jgi:hypothetical protein
MLLFIYLLITDLIYVKFLQCDDAFADQMHVPSRPWHLHGSEFSASSVVQMIKDLAAMVT